MSEILDVASKAGRERAVAKGEYRGDTLAAEGFIGGSWTAGIG